MNEKRHRSRVGISILLFTITVSLGLAGCRRDEPRQNASITEVGSPQHSDDLGSHSMDNANFGDVEIGSLNESAGTPKVDFSTFTGIKIAMPSVVKPGETQPVPLCGTWVLPESVEWRYESLEDSFVYLIRNMQTHEAYTGHFRWHEDPDDPSEEELESRQEFEPDDEEPDAKSQGWFNFDLARVWKIPDAPGKYRIQVILDEYQSNGFDFSVSEPTE